MRHGGEAVQGDQAERAGGDGTRESPAPRRPGGNRGFRLLALRVLAPAAAVVVLAAGGYGLSRAQPRLEHRVGRLYHGRRRGAVRRRAPRPGPTRPGTPTRPPRGPPRQRAAPRGIAPASFSLVTGQRNLTRAGLAQQVRAELLVPASARRTQTPSQQLRGCVAKLADGHTLELVESVHFEGRPATLVVARTGDGGHRLDSGPGLLGHLSSRTRHDHAAIGNLRALVSVHWNASQMRG